MIAILNAGALNLAMAIGYRTGLFDTLAGFDRPQPIDAIANQSGLCTRYIQEWLAVMTTGQVVEVTADEDGSPRYWLPKAHASCLTRSAGSENLGVYTQEIPLLTTCSLEKVIEGFSTGDGVSYRHYPQFQAFMSELAEAKHRQTLVSKFLPSVDGGRLLIRLKEGTRVCDLGCGEGTALQLMAEAFPLSYFVGLDISSAAIERARRGARTQGLKNVEFNVRNAARLTEDKRLAATFDYVTAFDAIHDQTAPLAALQGVRHLLKPGGLFSMVDIDAASDPVDNRDHPMGPFLYTVSLMHCMPVGLVDGGTGLGMMWGQKKALALLRQAGFLDVDVLPIPEDPFNLHYLCRR
jgi:ubiquinone/menaquinone biosynthesis C-methylase UbiE